MTHADARALVERQFEAGPLPPLEAQALRAHLRGCAECRRHYDRAVDLESLLEGRDAPRAQVERLVALGPPVVSKRRRAFWIAGAMAAAAALAVVLWPRAEAPDLQARGGGPTAGGSFAMYVLRDGVPRPTGETVRVGDRLLFAYTNLSGSPNRFLVIAGRDAAGHVHWFHPAYAAGSDPESIPVGTGVADRELPEAVYVDATPGPMQVCAVFTPEPLRVRDVDAALEAGGDWPAGTRACRTVEVGR
jgi:hypothetical protein